MEQLLQKFRVLRSSFPRIMFAVLPLTPSRFRLIIMSPVSSSKSSFHVKHNVAKFGIFILIKFENKVDVCISHVNFFFQRAMTNAN